MRNWMWVETFWNSAVTPRDLNVPYEDGKILHDLIVERKFLAHSRSASTGPRRSGVWALSKTGGKLTTVEIDPARQGRLRPMWPPRGCRSMSRMGDAHKSFRAQGRYDFVVSDADKDWYILFDAMYQAHCNACFTAHNVESRFGFTRVG
jgi:hypothetical protein